VSLDRNDPVVAYTALLVWSLLCVAVGVVFGLLFAPAGAAS
jgi:hypothetical protein